MPLTRIDSAFLDLDAIGGIDFDVQSGVPTLSVDATNHRVGIGTNSPAEKLEVYGNARFKATDGSHGIEFYPDVVGLGYQRIISFNRTSTAYENLSIGVNDFIVTTGSASERFRITSAGKVGIGTDDPAEALEVTGKILYSNVYSAEGDLPSASTYHGMFAHVHGTGKGYFAHAGNWVKLLDENGGSLSGALTSTSSGSFTSLSTGASGVGVNISTNTISGPATLTLDPAAVGDNTGTVVIAGNLQVDGTTTTINSTTLTVDDKNITLASGAANAAAADGAGIEIDGAAATLLYKATPDAWSFNKKLGIGTDNPKERLHVAGEIVQSSNRALMGNLYFDSGWKYVGNGAGGAVKWNAGYTEFITAAVNSSGADATANPGTRMVIKPDGNVGIGTINPAQKLEVDGNIKSDGYLGPNTADGSLWLTTGVNTQDPSVALWAKDHVTYPGQTHILGRTSNANSIAGQIRFYAYSGTAWSIRGMWGKNGYFGIRSSNSDPEVPLHIQAGGANDRTAYLTKASDTSFRLTAANGSGTNASGEETARFGINYSSTNSWGEYIKFVRGGGAANGSMGLYSSNTERVHIKADGNVGISTNNPADKFHVLGSATISSDTATTGNQFSTLTIGERPAADAYASIQLNYDGNSLSSKIDGRNGEFAIWANWNSTSTERLKVTGTSATESVILRPGAVDVIKAQHNISTGVTATYFAGVAHFQRTDTALEGGDIRFSRAVDDVSHYSIDVYGNSTTNPRLRFVNIPGSREDVHLNNTGNIGIGTNNATTKVVIHNGVVKLQGTSGGEDARVEFSRVGGRNGWIGIPDWDDDALMIYGPGVSSGNYLAAANEQGEWVFNGNNGTTSAEGLRIDQEGNVGIGTNNPSSELDVFSSTFSDITISSARTSGNIGGINFRKDVTGTPATMGQVYLTTDGDYIIKAGGNAASNEAIRIKANGNVGIGTNNPTYPLHVQESAYFRRGIQVAVLSSNELQNRSPINSGFYNVDNASTSDGWPGPNGWHHLLANTHSNTTNYYSQQFASSFFNQELYFRNTNSSGTTASQSWGQVMHTGSTLKPVYAESNGVTADWSRYWYPGGEYYVSVHNITAPGDFNDMIEQGYYHVANTASNNPASAYGYLNVHRHQGSQYSLQHFVKSTDPGRQWMRASYPDAGGSNGRSWYPWKSYGALERENTFTNNQIFDGNYYITFGPNSTWNKYLRVGGNGYQGNSTIATVATTNGNLHLDSADGALGVYLNWYGGTNGVYFGDGSSGQVARFESDGKFALGSNSKTNAMMSINGQSNQLLLKKANTNCPTVIHRNDGVNYYVLLSASGANPDGTWNTLRPLFINTSSGKLYSSNGQELSGGTKVSTSLNLSGIELDFTVAGNKYIDFYTANGNTVNFRMPTTANVFHTGIVMTRNSGVSLYHANSLKLYTTSLGAYVNGTLTESSDANLKENIVTVPNALDKVKAMRGVKFNWKEDGRADFGIIAQEAENVVPELVSDQEIKKLTQAGALKKRPDDSDYTTTTQKSFAYSSMVGILIEAMKEQQATIEALTARIETLENS